MKNLTLKQMQKLRPDIAICSLVDAFKKHSEKDCKFLHINNCPGCGRTCHCYKKSK